MRGLELPVNTLIVIVLAIIVLVAVIAFFMGAWRPGVSGIEMENAKNSGCQAFVSAGCDDRDLNIIIVNYDVDGNGAKDDSLLRLCEHYGCTQDNPDDKMACCRDLCHCP